MCTMFSIVIQKGFQPKQSLFREVMRETQSWAVKWDQSLRSLNTGLRSWTVLKTNSAIS